MHDIEKETEDEMILQLRIPHDRAMAWKTVALTLLTQRQIDCKTWHLIASTKDSLKVAGFDWAQTKLLEKSITSEDYNPRPTIVLKTGSGENTVRVRQEFPTKETSMQQKS